MLRHSIFASLLLAFALVAAEPEDARHPIPDKMATTPAEKMIKEIYKAEYLKTKPADRSDLANTLILRADESKDETTAQYIFLREGRDIAGKAGDLPHYREAAKKLAALFRISEPEALAGGADFLAVGVTGAASAEIGQTLVELVDDAVRVGEFSAAQKLLKAAETASRKANSPTLSAAVQARSKSMTTLRKEFDKVAEAYKTLETDPTDKKANLLVGRFQCYVKNDWDGGIARLLIGAEGPLRVAVDKDVAAASGGATERAEAGDQWKKLAASADPFFKKSLESRALHWYLEAVDEVTGLAKARVDKGIAELSNADTKWLILSHQINDPKNWQAKGSWTVDARSVMGEGQASRDLLVKLPSDCVIQFDMTIVRGDRTRIHLNQGGPDYWLGCEGDGNALTFHGDGARDGTGGERRYKRNEILKVKLEFKKDTVRATIDDTPPMSARRASQGVTLRISVGDGFSGGQSSYSNFRVSADGR